MIIVPIQEMIRSNQNNLNLLWNERRCIILALIGSDFNISEAWKINAPKIPLVSYKIRFYRHNLTLKTIKNDWHNYLQTVKKSA